MYIFVLRPAFSALSPIVPDDAAHVIHAKGFARQSCSHRYTFLFGCIQEGYDYLLDHVLVFIFFVESSLLLDPDLHVD